MKKLSAVPGLSFVRASDRSTADVVASISVLYHVPDCEISTSGNVGDKVLALGMIDHAVDWIRNYNGPSAAMVVIPSRDVTLKQNAGLTTQAFGDMPSEDRGDQQRRLVTGRTGDIYARVSIMYRADGAMAVDCDDHGEGKVFLLAMLADARKAIENRKFAPDSPLMRLIK